MRKPKDYSEDWSNDVKDVARIMSCGNWIYDIHCRLDVQEKQPQLLRRIKRLHKWLGNAIKYLEDKEK